MSRKTSPRVLKLKKLPRGRFTWKIKLNLDYSNNRRLPSYARKDSTRQNIPQEVYDFLKNNLIGAHFVNKIYELDRKTKKPITEKLEYILLDNATDVALFKLAYGQYIRQIYQIVLEQ